MERAKNLLLLVLLVGQHLLANNGHIAYIYPISGLTIDGDLSDWPAEVQFHTMETVHYGNGVEGPEDAAAKWCAGYDAEASVLYVGVEMRDDDYVKTPDNPHYSSHDFQVLYLDPMHSREGSGVIGYEIDEDHRKIVEQEMLTFYPQVRDASFDQVELQIKRRGNVVTYEWKVQISGQLVPGRVIGFDYGVFDKDTDQDQIMVTWGPQGGGKFMNSDRIGDLVLSTRDQALAKVNGQLVWADTPASNWPSLVRLSHSTSPDIFYSTHVDSTGHFSLSIPEGEYTVHVPTSRQMVDWNKIDIVEATGPDIALRISSDQSVDLEPITVSLVPKPDLIPEEGVLIKPFNEATSRQVDEFVAAYRAHLNIPAVSMALIQNGELVYHQTYGVENTISKALLRDEAVFEAASITKLVFAYAMNRLVQRGEFDLDKPLYETLPFPELEESPEYKKMTARHVLTHVSGLPNWGRELNNEPGTTYGYSGEGFEYLKRVLASEDLDKLPEIIQGHLEQEILEPLGMTNTYFMCNDRLPELKVAGHYDGIPNMFDCPDQPGMAYSMHTEAKDFVPFALALLNREGLTEAQAQEMFTIHTLFEEEDWTDGYQAGFGLGVALRDSPQGRVFGHGGNNGDFKCSFEMYEELKTGFIVFTNADTAEPFLYDLINFLVEGKKAE
ncbi:MAG: serine hydrolase [Bacteroidota bacterium]